MKDLNVIIEYLYHSGFTVETNSNFLIFDYYEGPIDFPHKQTFVFSSHGHSDHFNPQIFEWQKEKADIKYILSNDIKINQKVANSNLISMPPFEKALINNLDIKTFGSTDIGLSFLVKTDDITIFHAGDLNWWYWWGEPKEEIEKAEKMFKEEVSKIRGEQIDIAFFPVDPRLDHNYSLGAEYFISEVGPRILIPMHFSDDYEAIKRFKAKVKTEQEIIEITHRGQKIIL